MSMEVIVLGRRLKMVGKTVFQSLETFLALFPIIGNYFWHTLRGLLLGIALCIPGSFMNVQAVTVDYSHRTAYYTEFNDGGDTFDSATTNEVGQWANTGNKQTVAWRLFRTADGTGGSTRELQCGDRFKISVQGYSPYGILGCSLNDGASTASWADRHSNARGYIECGHEYGDLYVTYGSGSTASWSGIRPWNTTVTFVFDILSSAEFTATIDGQTPKYDLLMLNSPGLTTKVDGYSIYYNNDYNGTGNENAYWKSTTSVENLGYVEVGADNGTRTITGIISDGLAANSDSTESANQLRKSGSGTITLGRTDNTYSGGTLIEGGTLSVSADNGLGADPESADADYIQLTNGAILQVSEGFTLDTEKGITLTGNGGLQVDSGQTLSYNGIITGTGALSKTGEGTLDLGGRSANTFSGELYINNGKVFAGTNDPFDASAMYLGPASGSASVEFRLDSSTAHDVDQDVYVRADSGAGTRTIAADHTSGNADFTGALNLAEDLTLSGSVGGTIVWAGAIDLSYNDTDDALTVSGSGNVTISGSISADSSAAALLHSGTGILTLSGDNASSVDNQMAIALADGATLKVSAKNNLGDDAVEAFADKIQFTGSGTLNATASIDLSTAGAHEWGMTVAESEMGTFSINSGATFTIPGVISGAGALTKSSSGTLKLYGANTYTGNTEINGGDVRAMADSAFGNGGDISLDGGSIDADATFELSDARTITLEAGGGTFDYASSVMTFNGVISGAGALTKSSSGTLILGGANDYTGGVLINGGTVKISADSGLGADPGSPTAASITLDGGTLQVTADMTLDSDRGITLGAGDGTLKVDDSRTLSYAGIITGANELTKAGAGTLVLTGVNTYTGPTTVSSGTLQGDTTGLQGNIAVVAGTVVAFDQAGDGTYSGVISGDGALTKLGTGTVTLSGVNTYDGASTVAAGTLTVSGSAANSEVAVSAGATLAGNGPVGTLTLSGAVGPSDGDAVAELACGDLTLNGGGAFICHLGDASDTASRDVLNVDSGSGTVTINASSGDRFTIYLADSALSNWDADTSNDWVLVSAGTLTTFAADKFALDSTTYWSTSLSGGAFSLREENNDIVLTFEPGSTAPILIDLTLADGASSTATLGATLQDNGGETVTDYGVVWNTAADPTVGDHKVQKSTSQPAMPSVFTVDATGLTAGTLIYYRGYGINSVGTAYSTNGSFYTWSAAPAAHVTGLTFSGNEVSANLDWEAASGANGYLVLKRDGGTAPTGTPSDGRSYDVDDVIGDGTVVAVVTDGSTDAAVGSLERASQYSFTVVAFAWDASHGATCNYKTDGTIPSVSGYTLAANPDSAPANLGFTCIGFAGLTGMTVSWDKGTTAAYTLVAMEEGSAGIGASPSDKTAYGASTVFGSGDALQAGEYVVYSGDGTSVDVTGLNADTTYTVKLWSYNGVQAETLNYRTSDSLSGSGDTVAPAQAQNPTEANPTTAWLGDTVDLHVNAWFSWESNDRTAATVFYRWDNADLASSSASGVVRDPGHAVDDAYATTPVLTQLGTFYYALRISYDVGNDFYYWQDSGSWHDMSLSLPAAAEHTVVVSALNDPDDVSATRSESSASSEIDLSWTKTDGHGVMVVRKLSTGSWTEPDQGSSYAVAAALGDGTVVYNSAAAEVFSDGSLTAGTTYDYKFYSVNNDYYSAGVTAQASTRGLASASWDGGTDSSMITAANWSTDIAPDTGTDVNLYFRTGATRYTPNNDFGAGSDFGGLFFDSTTAYTLSGNAFQLYEKLENSNTATVTVSADFTLNGAAKAEVNPVGGDIQLDGAVALSGKNLEVYGGNGNTLFVNEVISGNANVYVKQNSIVEIAADCTYYDTYVQAGEVRVMEGGDAGAGTRTVTVGDAGTPGTSAGFYIGDADGDTTVNQAVVIVDGSSAANRLIGSRNASGVNTYADTVTLADDMTIDVTQSGGQCLFSAAITDGDSTCKVVKDGAGIAVMGAANTYSGNTEIDEGQLWIGDGGSLEDGTTIYVGNGSAQNDVTALMITDTGGGREVNEAIVVNAGADYTKRIVGAVDSTAANKFTGDMVLNGDVSLQADATAPSEDPEFRGVISGDFSVHKTGDGVVELWGENIYGGSTVIHEGALDLHNGSAVPDASAVSISSGATLMLTASETIGSVEGAGSINLGVNRTLSVGNPSGWKTVSGEISSSSGGALTYSGANDADACFILQGNNSYAGATTVSQGNMQGEHAAAFGTTAGGVEVVSGAQLRLYHASGVTVGVEALTLNGDGAAANGGTANGALRNIGGNNTWQGAVTLGSGARINSDADTLTISGAIAAGGNTLYAGGAGNVVLGAVAGSKTTGDGALFKDGAGTLSLSADNSGLSGNVYVKEGEVNLSSHGNAAGSGMVYVGPTAANDKDASLKVASGLTIPNVLIARPQSGAKAVFEKVGTGNTVFSGELRLSSDEAAGVRQTIISNTASGSLTFSGDVNLNGGTDENRALHIYNEVTISGDITNPPTSSGATLRGLVMHGDGTLTLDGALNANFFQDSGNVILGDNFSIPAEVNYQFGTADLGTVAEADAFLTFEDAGDYQIKMTVGQYAAGEAIPGKRQMNFEHDTGVVKLDGIIDMGTEADRYLIMSNAHDVVVTGTLTNKGGLRKMGAGTMTCEANAVYESETQVEEGILLMNSITNTSTLTVKSGAYLMGKGAVGPVVLEGTGTLAPGQTNLIGTLKATSVSFEDNAIFRISISDQGSSMLDVSGNVTLGAHATLVFTNYGGGNLFKARMPVIEYDGSSTAAGSVDWTLTGDIPANLKDYMSVELDAVEKVWYIKGADPKCTITNGASRSDDPEEVQLAVGTVDTLEYDLIYFDATAYPAGGAAANANWKKLYSKTATGDTTLFTNSMAGLNPGYMRFFRVSPLGAWTNDPGGRFASDQVYVSKNITLYGGKNWVSLPCAPENPTVSNVFGVGLPSAGSLAESTCISLYDSGDTITPTGTFWLADGTPKSWTWSEGGSGSADQFVLPVDQGFMITLPDNSPARTLMVVGALRTNQADITIGGADTFTFVNVLLPRTSHPDDLNLIDSGFAGGTRPMLSDRIYIWDRANQRIKNNVWMWYDTGQTRWEWDNNTAITGSPITQDDALLIYRRTGGSYVWTNTIYYTPPTPDMDP